MSGVKGKSGGARVGTGPKPKKFTFELDKEYLISETTEDGKFLPLQLATVVELDRKLIKLKTNENNIITISR